MSTVGHQQPVNRSLWGGQFQCCDVYRNQTKTSKKRFWLLFLFNFIYSFFFILESSLEKEAWRLVLSYEVGKELALFLFCLLQKSFTRESRMHRHIPIPLCAISLRRTQDLVDILSDPGVLWWRLLCSAHIQLSNYRLQSISAAIVTPATKSTSSGDSNINLLNVCWTSGTQASSKATSIKELSHLS